MRKPKNFNVMVFVTIVFMVITFHACEKKKEGEYQAPCKTCIARKNNQQVANQQACSEGEVAAFQSAHTDAEVTCN